MKPNYKGNKRHKEEARRKKQEEKRNKKISKNIEESPSEPTVAEVTEQNPPIAKEESIKD